MRIGPQACGDGGTAIRLTTPNMMLLAPLILTNKTIRPPLAWQHLSHFLVESIRLAHGSILLYRLFLKYFIISLA
jgi:hypothetical protein